MNIEDKIRWICETCGDRHGLKQKNNTPVAYTGIDCSWCRAKGKVVYRPDSYGLPVRNPQMEMDV